MKLAEDKESYCGKKGWIQRQSARQSSSCKTSDDDSGYKG